MMTDKNTQTPTGQDQPTANTGNLFKDILSGGILTREIFVSHVRYFLFLVVLGIFYIGNRYHSEYILRETVIVSKELKDAQAESIIVSSELLGLKKQSKIMELVNSHNLGLKPHVKPAKTLTIDE